MDEVIEAMARQIDPFAWSQYDNSVAPYLEGRGSRGDEGHWYARTWTSGCRTPSDVRLWWETCDETLEGGFVSAWRNSLKKATAAYNAMRAKLVPVGWLIDHPDYDAPIFDAEARPLTENESDEGFTMQPLYALPEIDNG